MRKQVRGRAGGGNKRQDWAHRVWRDAQEALLPQAIQSVTQVILAADAGTPGGAPCGLVGRAIPWVVGHQGALR